jgi:hypothetical protein
VADELLAEGKRELEPHVPDWQQSALILRKLAERTSPRHVQWRFDPILFTDTLGEDFYVERFRDIAQSLAGATQRCYFSFALFYDKVERQLRRARIRFRDPPMEEKQALVRAMADIANEYGISLYACCEDALVTGRVHKAHCVDGDLLADLVPERSLVFKFKPTRKQCGCVASRDIGMYDTCPHGCIYCYANQSHQVALERFRAHDPSGAMLVN